MIHTQINGIRTDTELGVQVTIVHRNTYGTITVAKEQLQRGRMAALGRWTLSRLREGGYQTAELVLEEIRTHFSETQITFLKGVL